MSMYDTPASEKSIYFDAPVAIFHSPSPPPDPMSTTAYTTAADPSIPAEEHLEQNQSSFLGPHQHMEPQEFRDDRPVMHPNGSEGWLPATAFAVGTTNQAHTGSILKRGSSPTSSSSRADGVPSPERTSPIDAQGGAVRGDQLSRSASRRSTFTNRDGRTIVGSAFMNGAGTTGPYAVAEHDGSLHMRSASAERSLSQKQKARIAKQEARDGKQLSKIIKQEAKAEKQAVVAATNELANLQKVQHAAVKLNANPLDIQHEMKAQAVHAKVMAAFKKTEAAYLAAKTEYDAALARLNSEEEALERIRSGAREATERVQEKSQELDGLRTMLAVDTREREVKLTELKGKARSGSWRR